MAGRSRYATRQHRVLDPLDAPDTFALQVSNIVRRESVRFVIPVGEASALALLTDRATIQAEIPFPGLATFRAVCDKAHVTALARDLGFIRTPAQRVVTNPADLAALVEIETRFPVVLKPARSVVAVNGKSGGSLTKHGVVHARDRETLRRAAKELGPAAFPVLVQDRIEGPGIGIFVLIWNGELLAAFSHRRIREKPPSGGVSVCCESIPLDKGLLDRSVELLHMFGWQGVAMVEYKLDSKTGTPMLMEINGRFWGSLQLAIDAGVDFPALLLRAAEGEKFEPVMRYRVGVRSRWLWGDIDHLIARMRRSPRELNLSPDAPHTRAVFRDFFAASGPGTRGDVLRLDDPLPFIHESLRWIKTL
jgi:predicted ATP-grasp superfamily ATP-dependent carboligase